MKAATLLTQVTREDLARTVDAARAKYRTLKSIFDDNLHDFEKFKDVEAEQRAASVLPQMNEAEVALNAALSALASFDSAERAEREKIEVEANERRPERIARLRSQYAARVGNVHRLAQELMAEVHALFGVGLALQRELQANYAHLFSPRMIEERMRQCFARVFAYEVPENPEAVKQRGYASPPLRVLMPLDGWINAASKYVKMSFPEAEAEMLDNTCHFYETEEEATAARNRLDPSGANLHVVRCNDDRSLFTLVSGQKRAS